MASIEKRMEGGKAQYRARWRDAEGKSRRSRWFDRKHDADKLRATIEADLHRGSYVDMSNPTTVAEYARQWVAVRPLRPMSRVGYELLIRVHLERTPLGGRPLVKVRPSEIQAWATGRAQTLAPKTLLNHIGLLRSIFGSAVLDGVIARNPVMPANRLSLPKREHRPVVPLTVEQVRALADEMSDRYRAMVIAQAGLGLRMGELLALRAEDVNFLRREVRIEWQLEAGSLKRVPPKTPHSRRTIPLPQVVAEALAQHIREFPPAEDGTLFTRGAGRGGPASTVKERPERIFHQQYGGYVRRAAERAGLPATTTHDLRHHYASVLVHAGESVYVVAERLGHTDARLVLTTYGHLMPDQEDRTRRAVDDAWSKDATEHRSVGG